MTNTESPVLASAQVLPSASVDADGIIETAPGQWEYAWQLPLAIEDIQDGDIVVLTLRVQVLTGAIGLGIVAADVSTYLVERYARPSGTEERVVLRAPAASAASVLVRNVHEGGASRFRVLELSTQVVSKAEARYPITVTWRDFAGEADPPGGRIVFNDGQADSINVARMETIRQLNLPLEGKRVLDVGAGVGHFARLYSSLGATVVAVEGRPDNVTELRERYPEVEAHIGDVQDISLAFLGKFDIVHAFGLLYHLDSPVSALRRMEEVTTDLLLLETMVCDSSKPAMVLADETKSVNQALAGVGCRPSPSFVAMALNRIGFRYVYGVTTPPAHEDFLFEWRDNLDIRRDGHNLRCVFVASRREVTSGGLVPLLEP